MADFARKPLSRYPEPAYPELCDHRVPAAGMSASLKRAIALALIGSGASLTTAGCFGGSMLMGDAPSPYLESCVVTDTTARAVLLEAFEQRGYQINEDYPIGTGALSFEADGFDKVATVGFEYQAHSEGDSLDFAVEEQLWQWNQGDGPFFLILDEATYDCDGYGSDEASALDELRVQVEAFFTSLADQGAI